MSSDATDQEQRVLVFTHLRGDAVLTQELLSSVDVASLVCTDAETLTAEIDGGAAAVIATEEALTPAATARLVRAVEAQPPWSDLPVIVSVAERRSAASFLDTLGPRMNVVAIERPVRAHMMISAVQTARRARRRQYETRATLRDLERLTADLRGLEEEMRAVVENLPELAWWAQPDGHVNFYNHRWYEYTGTTFEEVEGWGWQRLHDPEILPQVVEGWRASIETGAPFEMEFPLRRADGVFRWFLTRVTPLRDKAGRVLRWIGVTVDIDDRRRSAKERELFAQRSTVLARASELLSASLVVEECHDGFARALLESLASCVTIDLLDEAGRLDGATVLVDRDATLARRCREVRRAHPIGPGHPLLDALNSGRARIYEASRELEAQLADGVEERRSLYAALALRSAIVAPLSVRGATIGVIAVGARDRRYTEDDLALVVQLATRAAIAIDNARLYAVAQRERLRTGRLQGLAAAFSAAHTTTEVAQVALTQGCEAADAPRGLLGVLTAGDTVLEVLLMRGFPTETATAWPRMPMTMSGPLTDATRRGAPAFYSRPEDIAAAFPHLADQRSPGDNALAVLPLIVGGRTFGAMALVYDEPRSFQEADRTQLLAIARLCAQAMDRASLFELSQRERQSAEQANRSKDEFLAMVSHELRTPLNAMLGWSRMLRTGDLDPALQDKAIQTIERNALAQAQLVEDLLDITRIITGKLRLSIAAVDLANVIEAAMEAVKPAADAKGVRLQSVLDPIAGHVAGDADRLQQVIWNLLSNAVKFTPKGGRVHVRLYGKESNAEILIEDSGIGIAPELLPHVFERFRQADGGTTRSFGGLGLGLSIVKNLVELHGGTVAASSEGLDRGASFVVRIPVAPVCVPYTPPVRPSASDSPRHEPPGFPAQLAGLRVLVVDDEPDARDLLVAVLEQCEVDVKMAATAAEALEYVAVWRPDVILSDVGMPVEDGYAFIQKVRALPRDRGGGTPAVALTAYARIEDRRRAMLAGFNMHVSKPIEPAELLIVLANVGGRLTRTDGVEPGRA